MQDYILPDNVIATTSMEEAIAGAQYAIHAVPVQHSRVFLESVKACTTQGTGLEQLFPSREPGSSHQHTDARSR